MAKITSWVISVWRNINKTGFAHSKPYNPGLGELFKCSWEHEEDNSVTYYMAEQVSHHPPISAYYSYNKKRKMVFEGFLEPKTSFSINNATTSITGRNSITLQNFKERYNIKYANVVAKSIFWGTSRIEVSDQLLIYCPQTGLASDITLDGETVSGSIFNKKLNKKLYTISGKLSLVIAKDLSNNKQIKLYDSSTLKVPSIKVASLSEQAENESRKIWHKVTVAIRKEDYDEATKQKKYN